MSDSTKALYEFGAYRLDTSERTLSQAGQPVPLTPKAYDVLHALVQHAGHIVEKDQLMKEVWPDAFVEEGNLTHHIFTLRKALSKGESEYIETLPRRGYRFVCPVRKIQDELPEGQTKTTPFNSKEDTIAVGFPSKDTNSYKKLTILAIALVIVGLGCVAVYKYFEHGRHLPQSLNSQKMAVRKLTSSSKVTTAAISPDGKYVVYSKEDSGKQSLWLKQTATLSEVQIVLPAEVTYFGSTFTFDGDYLYYSMEEKNRSNSIYKLAAVGGSPRKIVQDVESSISLSPDNRRLAFVRINSGHSEASLWVVNVDGDGERMLSTRKNSEWFEHGVGVGPAWSPDGKVIACSIGGSDNGRQYHNVAAVDVSTGEQKLLASPQGTWEESGQVVWRTDGSGILAIGDGQVWQLSYPRGDIRKITNDANSYIGISLTAKSDSLVTVQLDIESSIWVTPEDQLEKAKPISSGRQEGYHGLSWTPDDKIVYSSVASGGLDLWVMESDGTGRKQLTENSGRNYAPSVSSDGRYIVFTSTRTGTAHIWRINIDGSNPHQLTMGDEERWPECSPDGRWVVYAAFGASTAQNIWKVPIEGGNSVPVTTLISNLPTVSPDARLLAFRDDNAIVQPLKISVVSFADGSLVKSFGIQPTTIMTGDYKVLRWTPDGSGLAYIDTRSGMANIWVRPLNGGPEKQVTDFKSDQMFRFDWSRDGKYLALTRGAMMKDVILMSGFE